MWVPIRGYEDLYELNEIGEVRRKTKLIVCKDGRRKTIKSRLLKVSIGNHGYKCVTLSMSDKKKSFLVHRLIASHFMGPSLNPKETDINHKNGIKTDNRIENLEWITRGDNVRHAHKIGLHDLRKSKMRISKLCIANKISYGIAGEIRFMYEVSGLSQKEIGAIYGVSQPLVGRIVRNEIWTHSEDEKRHRIEAGY